MMNADPGRRIQSLASRFVPLFVWALAAAPVVGQDLFSMTDGSETSCQGVLFDSGGQGAAGYQNGEDYQFTLCPDVPGNVIYFTFSNFDLDQSGPQNSWDNLSIYDGDNTGATYLGSYTGDALQNLIVSGSVLNITGCLTLVFQSNSVGTGVWAASFSCTIPCQNPNASAFMSEAVPALVCVDEPVTFNGTDSEPVGNNTIVQYLWNFDDGTVDSTSGPIVNHAFTEDGEHVVQLYVTDDNGCKNLNLVDLQVLVSTTPNFGLTSESTETCFGATVSLYGEGLPVTWTGIPDANFGEGIFLPDDVGLPFTSTLNFEQFNPGQTLTDINDIESICVEMEHTYMGDLVLQVICPNGSTVILHQQGGGGTYLGEPNDYDSNADPIFGACWEYCWSPTASNGTWIENLTNTTTAGTPPNNSLNPGTYESVQMLSLLEGCPLNGEWTYQSTDLWGADNGFICSWSINFNPAIIPDVTTFTPTFGSGSDSSLWSGGTVPDYLSANGDTAIFTADAPGDYDFQYQVTDNFGCTYDTTITVNVAEPFTIDAGPDQVICNDPVPMAVSMANSPGFSIEWSWSPDDGVSNPTIPNPTILVTSPTTYTVTANVVGEPACFATDEVMVTLDPGLDPGLDSLIVVCMTPPSFDMITMLAGTPNPGGIWTDANGNVVGGNFNPMIDPAGVYTYTVTSNLGCVGTAELEIQLLDASDPTCCGIVDAGPDATICTLEYDLSASVGNTGMGSWIGPAGYTIDEPWNAQTEVTAPNSGPAEFFWIEDDGILCYLIDSVTITFTQPLQATVTRTDAICFEACDGTASVAVTGGIGAFSYEWTDNLAGDSPEATSICTGLYSVTVTDENGCSTSDDFSIMQPPLLEIDATSYVEPWCNADCNGSITLTDAEAVEYSFNGGVIYQASATKEGLCAGPYAVAIKNADGCIGTGLVMVTEPPEVVAEFDHIPVPANTDHPVITFYNQSENDVAWLWDMAGLGTFMDENPQFRFSDKYPGTYEVCLISFDNHGCSDTVCHDVVIDDVLQTYAPNSFTPDGDGVNDSWWMVSNIPDITTFEMRVFDRWGRVVFESTDPTQAWDGTHMNAGGEVIKQDVYAFRCTFQIISTGGLREYMGHVSVMK